MKKNGRFYLPYILTCIFTIMMFYNMCSIYSHEGLKQMRGSDSIILMMGLGCYVIGIFAVIFLFYTNNFLMRRRKKELGLYNILGMEKRHIAKILLYESIYTFLISIIVGIGCGVLFNQLIVMLMEKIVQFPVVLKSEVNGFSFYTTVILFFVIFCLCLISNWMKIKLSKPIELLHGQNVGEREPKTKWLLALIGFVCIGIGYYIALTTESPITALPLFFVSVILVIIGTYCLFTAGSIAVLKILKKKKSFYYQTKHFTTISGMIYRMKQNAVGLANICILSTMVLVMLSGTVSLYLGMEDALNFRYPNDISIKIGIDSLKDLDTEKINQIVDKNIQESDASLTSENAYTYLDFSVGYLDGTFTYDTYYSYVDTNTHVLVIFTLDSYEKMTNQEVFLQLNEVFIYHTDQPLKPSFELFGKTYQVKETLASFPFASEFSTYLRNIHYIVVPGLEDLVRIYQGQKEVYQDYASEITYRIDIDLDGSNEEKLEVYSHLLSDLREEQNNSELGSMSIDSKEASRDNFISMYGGFLFLGCFLGALFIMVTVLIIYYKQISEGYEDKERFQIMQKVGMSKSEVRKSIHSQVLMVFFLPLLMAAIHVLAAFKIIAKLLGLLNLVNVPLFAACTIGTIIVFALIYTIVYALTARTYYRIVD